ncbi:MAG: hypothetical protein ACRDOL_05020 [Streptosporangiaceae bacterium]
MQLLQGHVGASRLAAQYVAADHQRALVIARSMSAVGSVTVSDRRSMMLTSTRFRAMGRRWP